jgi:FkbM family methyltransferase
MLILLVSIELCSKMLRLCRCCKRRKDARFPAWTWLPMNLRQLIKYILWRDTTHHGEFSAIQRLMPPSAPKVVVDVGANDGFYGSNSFPFVAKGWRAILIEPHPAVFAQLQERFKRSSHVTCLNLACAESSGKRPLFLATDGRSPSLSTLSSDPGLLSKPGRSHESILVPVETLADVLNARQIPKDFGLLSIDTEGMDYEVLLGLNCSVWHPRVIITEDYESKDALKAEYLESHNYRLRAHIKGGNTIWSRNSI